MKLAILSDIHGNLPALETVLSHVDAWGPDAVVVNGDVVNRGPWPRRCLEVIEDRVERQGWRLVRGNHEDYVVSNANPGLPRSGPAFDIRRNSWWTYQRLEGDVGRLAAWPFRLDLIGPNGRSLQIVHGSVHSNRDSIFPDIRDEALRAKMSGQPAVFATAHTHRPFERRLGATLVVNSGSVGVPFDGDYRAAYARLTWANGGWSSEIVRLDYDREATVRGFTTSGFIDGGGPLARLMLRELLLARSLTFAWDQRFHRAIHERRLTVAESVDRFLADLNGT